MIKKLFHDQTFLPNGGYFGFGLLHKYSFNQSSSSDLGQIAANLKDGDDKVKRFCGALGLEITLKVVYSDRAWDNSTCCLLDHFFNFKLHEEMDEEVEELGPIDYIYEVESNPIIVYPDGIDLRYEDFAEIGKPIMWLREITKTNSFNSSYLQGCDNKGTKRNVYGNLCLVVEVAKAAKRVS